MVDVEEGEGWMEEEGMDGRRKSEGGVKYVKEGRELGEEGGKKYWVIWVGVDMKEEGGYYGGVTGCELLIKRRGGGGYK
uniref:YwhD family protein n=1 Tax=Siminovitchia fortis TaxID=254758 RepID=UPI001642AF70